MTILSGSNITRGKRGLMLMAALIAPAIAGCAADRVLTTNTIPTDYRARHPIVLSTAPVSTDILSPGGRLDASSRDRVRAFAREYRNGGEGPISVQIPTSGGYSRQVIDDIRREIAAGGAQGSISVSNYEPADPSMASPIRLSYVATKASVRGRCGDWPRDLASGGGADGWDNKPYWNHGCAFQQALANQVADPRDLASPRAEAPSDVMMRTRAITKVREGADPGTAWMIENTAIGSVGAN